VVQITIADLAACENADSFLQSSMWGRFKSRFGWQAHAFIADWEHGGAKPLLVLSRRMVPGLGMAYIPWGPELPADFPDDPSLKAEALTALARALRPLLPRNTVFIRFDPPWNGEWGMYAPLTRASADIQPPDTVLIDLNLSPDDILTAMKPKWRYNIGLAKKHNIVVSCNYIQNIDIFYKLLTETASRDGIAIHSIKYYRALFEECKGTQTTLLPQCGDAAPPLPTPYSLNLYTAAHENDILAAIVVLFRGKAATYMYGASTNVKRNLMAPYALQWKAMQDARAYGCTVYDLFGIPPNKDPDHPMAGLYRFKTGFGGRIIHRPGSWDYPCKAILYALFRYAEHLRKKIRDRRKRR
jgi:lipid II:glycine glycyltransferase (peptidoglycan interpeptide bridge formation enzyme)